MASAWAGLSDDQKESYEGMGYNKKSFNDQFGKGGETPPPIPSSSSSSSSSSPDNRVAARETAQSISELNDNTAAVIERDREAAAANPTAATEKALASGLGSNLQFPERSTSSAQDAVERTTTRAENNTNNFSVENQAVADRREIKKSTAEANDIAVGERSWQGASRSAMTEDDAEAFDNAGQVIYGKEDINDYDFSMGGIGSIKGKNVASKADIKGLMNYGGFSAQEIQDRINTEGDTLTVKSGAQSLLDSYINDMTDPGTPDITQPGSGGEDTLPGGGNDTQPAGGGEDTQPAGGGEDTQPAGGGQDTLPGGGSTIIGNVQDVEVNQINEQEFNNNINNEFNQTISGNNNTVDNAIDNSVVNFGGDQENASTVTQGSDQQAQDLLGSYVDDFSGAGQTTAEASQPSGSTGFRRGQDLMNPNYFRNRQNADIDQGNDQTFNNNINNIFTQDVSGDGNFISNDIDNSVRNYGGDQRNFSYVSNNSNPYTDTPASMATLAGYNSVSDSPASNASFVDMYQTLNRDAQKQYDSFGMANEMIYRGNSVAPFDPAALDAAIQARPQTARDRATVGFGNVFGDMANFPTFNFEMPPPPDPIEEFDPEELYNQFT